MPALVLPPARTVGVMGDERSYENVIALRVVESQNGMTAKLAHARARPPSAHLQPHQQPVRGVNRVIYDTSSKPPRDD